MDLENLKNIWSDEKIVEIPEISFEKQKEIHHPLEKIRKNMRLEFWSSAVTYLFLIAAFFFINFPSERFKVYAITLVASMLLVSSVYFFKFFRLYKNISEIHFNTHESLGELNFQLQLNKQYYLGYYIAFAPLIVCEMLLVFDYIPKFKVLQGMKFLLYFVGSCVVFLTVLFLNWKWWFDRFYGKYFKQIEKLMLSLK